MHGDKMTQTGKASAKPEYSFSIAFVVVLLLFFFLFVCFFRSCPDRKSVV